MPTARIVVRSVVPLVSTTIEPPTTAMAGRWLRVAADPLGLKVVTRAANTLGIHKAQALGHLTALWSWLSKQSDDGSLVGITDDEIEDAVEWTGTRGAFALFVRNRHVDAKGCIRDWDEYMGPLVKARQGARRRMRGYRQAERAQQDAEADRDWGGSNGSPPVTRNIEPECNNVNVTRNTNDVRRTNAKVSRYRDTDIELRKSIRTTGMYLCSELELVRSESKDDRAYKSSIVKNQNCLDAHQGQMHGAELVRAFARRFYRNDNEAMLDALRRLRAVLRPAGVTFQGETIRATPELVVRAMNETLAHPPSIDQAAIVFVLKKLASGHLHETRTDEGELVTEALANEGRSLGRDITANLTAIAPELFAGIKSIPESKRASQQTSQPTIRGACANLNAQPT